MKYIYIIIVAVAFMCCLALNTFSQDMRFSQPYNNPLKLNPAIMGENKTLKFLLNYRSEWAVIKNGYTTYSFSTLLPISLKEDKSKLDIGLNVNNDKAGAFSLMDITLAVNCNLKIAENQYFSVAISGGYIQRTINSKSLTFDNQYILGSFDASNSSNENKIVENVGAPEVGFGILWFFNPPKEQAKLNAFIGVSGFHLNNPNLSHLNGSGVMPKRFVYHAGVKILGEKNIDITPDLIVDTQNKNFYLATGINLDYRFNEKTKLLIGAWYRKNDAFPFMVGFEFSGLAIHYSYDVPTSNISSLLPGVNAHEMTLVYKLKGKESVTKFN